jgi:hypothetical protein
MRDTPSCIDEDGKTGFILPPSFVEPFSETIKKGGRW